MSFTTEEIFNWGDDDTADVDVDDGEIWKNPHTQYTENEKTILPWLGKIGASDPDEFSAETIGSYIERLQAALDEKFPDAIVYDRGDHVIASFTLEGVPCRPVFWTTCRNFGEPIQPCFAGCFEKIGLHREY